MSIIQASLSFLDVDSNCELPELSEDPEDLPSKLTEHGYDYIELRVLDYTARLAIRDDATFLADAYVAARDYVLNGASEAKHVAYLGDGEVVVAAAVEGERVSCEIRYCPQLNVRYVFTKHVDVHAREYAGAWWRVVDALTKPLKTLP